MNLDRLHVFHVVAELRSFTRAAERLHLTQPGVSKHIRELEAGMGTRLFDRLGKRIGLTTAGEILFAATGKAFEFIDEARVKIADLHSLEGGKLVVGASVTIGTYILPAILGDFHRAYPCVEVVADVALSGRVVQKVLANAVDVGLIGHPVDDDRLHSEPFMTDDLVLIVPACHRWAGRLSVPFEELWDEPFILPKSGSGTRTILEHRLRELGVVLTNTMEFGSTEGVKKAVEAGLGVAVISRKVVERELEAGLLRAINLAGGGGFMREFRIIRRKDKYKSKAVEAFLKFFK